MNEAVTRFAPAGCEVRDSSRMALQEMTDWLTQQARRHATVVRLQTGDPALYGALIEMARPLSAAGIEWAVVPGVSSAMAAMAAAGESLTLPEVTQTVVLTRVAGRTPMPEGEDLAALAAHRDKEVTRGVNLVGAHRDDLLLHLGALPAKGFASHGEQWSLAMALRLASYDMLRTDVDAYGGDGEPVLILDDVFASLDEQRRRALARMVAGAQQVLLTAAVDDDIPDELAGARYRVADGEVARG